MDNEINYSDMGREELTVQLTQLGELLDEVREEREMILGQTGHHISSTKLFKAYRKEIEEIMSKIELVKKLLGNQ